MIFADGYLSTDGGSHQRYDEQSDAELETVGAACCLFCCLFCCRCFVIDVAQVSIALCIGANLIFGTKKRHANKAAANDFT